MLMLDMNKIRGLVVAQYTQLESIRLLYVRFD